MHMKNKNMKKKNPNSDFRKWMGNISETLVNLYGVGGVTIIIHEKKATESQHGEGVVLFRINYSNAYKTANIWFFPHAVQLFKEKNFAVLRQAITHEIAHILTNPLADLATERYVSKRELDDATETLTEQIGQLCRKLMTASKIEMM